MEMDSAEPGHDGECILEETSANSPDTNDIFGDSDILPRVGHQYQVEIPSLLTDSERVQLMKNPADAEFIVDHSFAIGLPVSIVWVHKRVNSVKLEQIELLGDPAVTQDLNRVAKCNKSKESHINLKKEHPNLKAENLDFALDHEKGSGVLTDEEANRDQKCSGKGYSPLPGSTSNSWSDIELESLLLGLYIFGKNLVQVKRFVESKEMGDLLSYYYGKFYRSDRYRRWSECQKMRSRKCIHGQRIFTGSRQQELLSRLLPRVSEECKNTLLEVSRTFSEGKISLEDYVFSLKATVGTNNLVEAIGIGKGKQDLTGMMDPINTKQVAPVRQEIPTGKECNSLSSGDIVKFLTGDFRLSKAKSSDLFWEAVWPRLLARGWHSEQPKNKGYAVFKNSLVFLVPGVKKFSRRRHVKGNHYFDSVTDVLNKVATEPGLLEVESEAPRVNGRNEENGCDTEKKLDQDGSPDHRRHCYLRPQISNCNSDIMKFTVVDTSLCHEEGPFKLRELRTLPVDNTVASTPTSLSRETDSSSSEEPEDELGCADRFSNNHVGSITSRPRRKKPAKGAYADLSNCVVSVPKERAPINGLDNTNIPVDNCDDQYADTCNDKHSRKTVKRELSQKMKPGKSKYLAPVTKRRRLTACEHAETKRRANDSSTNSDIKQKGPSCHPDSSRTRENMVSEVGLSQEKVSCSSTKDNPDDNSLGILSENCVQKAGTRALIDLNLPHVEEDFENGETFITEVADSQGNQKVQDPTTSLVETNHLEDSQTEKNTSAVIGEENQLAGNARRQSTRNRPLTTKALEALACGFFSTTQKRKGTKDTVPRPPRRVRRKAGDVENTDTVANGAVEHTDCVATGVVDPKVDEGVEEESSSNTGINMVNDSQVQSESKVAHQLLGVPDTTYHLLSDRNN